MLGGLDNIDLLWSISPEGIVPNLQNIPVAQILNETLGRSVLRDFLLEEYCPKIKIFAFQEIYCLEEQIKAALQILSQHK